MKNLRRTINIKTVFINNSNSRFRHDLNHDKTPDEISPSINKAYNFSKQFFWTSAFIMLSLVHVSCDQFVKGNKAVLLEQPLQNSTNLPN